MRHPIRHLLATGATAAVISAFPAATAPAEAPGGPADGSAARTTATSATKVKPLLALADELLTDQLEAERPHHPVAGPHDYGESAGLFGASRGGRSHEGQDVFAAAGTPLVAVRDGKVVETGNDGGRGNYVAIYAPENDRTYVYLHMVEPASVSAGERVKAGQRVGAVGCTGSCWGDHLHFEIRTGEGPYGTAHDPLPALQRWESG